RLILPSLRPNDPRREFANSIHCYSRPINDRGQASRPRVDLNALGELLSQFSVFSVRCSSLGFSVFGFRCSEKRSECQCLVRKRKTENRKLQRKSGRSGPEAAGASPAIATAPDRRLPL